MFTLGTDACDCPCCTRRRAARHRRHAWLGAVPLALAAVATAPLWRPRVARAVSRARARQWRRWIEHLVLPPEQVVYEEEPQRVTELLRRPDWTGATTGAGAPLAAWLRLGPTDPFRDAGLPLPADAPTLFVHRRTWADGSPCVVAVTYANPALHVGESLLPAHSVRVRPNPTARHAVQTLLPDDRRPTLVLTLRSPDGSRTARFPWFDVGPVAPAAAPVRFYAGQPDPHDPRRFTLTFEAAGHRGRVTFALGAPGSVAQQTEYPID